MTGYEAAKHKREQLATSEPTVVEPKTSLTLVNENSELFKLYKESTALGVRNITGSIPYLKIHQAGKSTTNELADGTRPNDGSFFYMPEKSQYESVVVHVLSISAGFRAPGLSGSTKDVFNQIMSGVLVDDGSLKPFLMFFTGLKLQNLWNFGKEVAVYNRIKPVGIPMFALTTKLTTERVKNTYGESWLVNFEILKKEDGSPDIVLDPTLFTYLRDHVEIMEQTAEKLIEAKSTEKE